MTHTRGRRTRAAAWLHGIGVALLLAAVAHPHAHAEGGENSPPATRIPPPVAPPPRPTTDLYGDPLPAGAVARLGSVRLRHLGLADYFVGPDGNTACTVGRDGFLRTWDLATGRQTDAHALGGEFGPTVGRPHASDGPSGRREREPHLVFSPDRRFVAAVCPARVVVWDAGTGRELKTLARPKARLEWIVS